jgi:transposase-like protein
MVTKKRRKFEIGFKRQLLAQIASGEITISEAARTHDISPTVIYYWQRQQSKGSLVDGPTVRERELEKENEKLKAKIGDMAMQIDHLKKLEDLAKRQKKLNTSVVTGLNLAQFKKGAGK